MNPMALYAAIAQTQDPPRSKRDGVVTKRRSRRSSRRTASRTFL
jgi:hypothetical protein